jgi:hypothetical protein
VFIGFLSGCCCDKSGNVCPEADGLSEKLRIHFLGGRVGDVSTLISETRIVSKKLKAMGLMEEANKFDSYTDVLMYGNHTINESLEDVVELIKQPPGSSVCSPTQCLKSKLCSLF